MPNATSITVGWDTKQNLKEKKLEFEKELKKCLSWDAFFDIANIKIKKNGRNRGKN